jgi:molecular chaperone DnaK
VQTDKKRREIVDLKNQGESLHFNTEKSLGEHKDKLSAEDSESNIV